MQVAGSLWSVPTAHQLPTADRWRRGGVRRLHWDSTDGRFAAAGGFTAERARELTTLTGMRAEAHLMVAEPVRHVDAWTDFCDVVFLHAEVEGWAEAARRILRRGSRPGLAIALETSLDAIPPDVPVLCMSITPGAAGSAFDPRATDRVRRLVDAGVDRAVSVDGGVTRRILPDLSAAGADGVVVGGDLVAEGGLERWADVLGGLVR